MSICISNIQIFSISYQEEYKDNLNLIIGNVVTFWTHPYKITAGEVPGAYFIKLLFGSGMEPAFL